MSNLSVPSAAVRDRQLLVAAVPADHVYVRHLVPESGPRPVLLPDPDPDDRTRSAVERWWPPVKLDPAWAVDADFDVFHIHFGFDASDPRDLRELVDVLSRRRKPLVLTVHDLRNPHHETGGVHDAQLDVLVQAADAVLTLTSGAAEVIRRRWGRDAQVVPHPHVVDFRRMAIAQDCRARRTPGPFRVGLHVKSLRASMDPGRLLPALIEATSGADDAVLAVNGHRDVLEPDGARHDPVLTRALRRAESRGELELHVHDFLSDDDLWTYLAALDVSVLPYRFGTHSGWLEACRDLGTTVVAPSCGFFAEQGPVLRYVHDEEHYDPASLVAAVRRAYDERPAYGASVDERRRQRREVAELHDAVYRSLLLRGA